jgi:branched-chain amino acid transport system substrate-binding protein
VPNDNQQAASIFKEIYNERNYKTVAVISDSEYDSKSILDSFLKTVKVSGKPVPVQFFYDNYANNPELLADEIIKSDVSCVVLLCRPSASLKIMQQIRQNKINKPVFGSLMILNENDLTSRDLEVFDDLLAIPSGKWNGSVNLAFRQKFQKEYHRLPGLIASYSYDSMSVLIEAIRSAGTSDHEKIQKALENTRFNGITGMIRFDSKGNRSGTFEVMKTKDGVPVN